VRRGAGLAPPTAHTAHARRARFHARLLHLGARRDEPRGGSPLRPWLSSTPDQATALRRLRAAFGFVQVLRIVDHEADQDQDDNEPPEQ
jgi:hypothetical protein